MVAPLLLPDPVDVANSRIDWEEFEIYNNGFIYKRKWSRSEALATCMAPLEPGRYTLGVLISAAGRFVSVGDYGQHSTIADAVLSCVEALAKAESWPRPARAGAQHIQYISVRIR